MLSSSAPPRGSSAADVGQGPVPCRWPCALPVLLDSQQAVVAPLVGDVASRRNRERRAPVGHHTGFDGPGIDALAGGAPGRPAEVSTPGGQNPCGRVLSPTLQRGRLRRQRGAALVEFVIVFPILMTLVFSIWEAGRIFDAWLISTNSAREGARYAVEWTAASDPVNETLSQYVQKQVMAYVDSAYGSRVNTAGGDVTIAPADITVATTTGGGPLTVAVTAHVTIFAPTPFTGFIAPGGFFPISAWTTMYQ